MARPKNQPEDELPKAPAVDASADELDEADESEVDPAELSGDDDESETVLPTAMFGEGSERSQIVVQGELRKRLDVYLQSRLKGVSRSRVQKLIDLGAVTIEGKTVRASLNVKAGDVIDVTLPRQAVREIKPEPIPLAVLYEDDHFIVINKQANLIIHPARSNLSGTLINALAYRFQQRVLEAGGEYRAHMTRGVRGKGNRIHSKLDERKNGAKKAETEAAPAVENTGESDPAAEGIVKGLSAVGAQEFRPGIIHRLDKNTTGVIVVAKAEQAHWGIAKQFEDRSTLKVYLALVHGNPDVMAGAIEEPIGKHPTIREAMAVRHDTSAKHALTLYRVREQYEGYSLVELEIKTGRTHQIRVHLAFIGHPIVGDILYGGEAVGTSDIATPIETRIPRRFMSYARDKEEGQKLERIAKARNDLIIAHPALHACLLRIRHPITREVVTFTAPLHEPVGGLVRSLRERVKKDGPTVTEGAWIDLNLAVPPGEKQATSKRATAKKSVSKKTSPKSAPKKSTAKKSSTPGTKPAAKTPVKPRAKKS